MVYGRVIYMSILLILIMAVVLYLSLLSLKQNVHIETDKGCKPHHKWVMKVEADHNGYLICKNCGKTPGNIDD